MKHFFKNLKISSVGVAVIAQAQVFPPSLADDVIQPVELVPMKSAPRNRVSLSYRLGLNITANFKNLGGLAALSNPGAATGGAVDRTYDNGYNLVDVSGNDHGPGFQNTTWNWGYQNPGSLQGNQMVFNSSSSPATASSKNNSDDPQHGFELGYSRELWQKGDWRFGLEAALGYTKISIGDSRTLFATVHQITDSFTIPGGVTIPPAPYNGSFNGPGAVIGSDPSSRTISDIAQGGTISGSRLLDANVYSVRLGPYAEYPLDEKLSLRFSGGLYLAAGDMRFSYKETVTIPGTGSEFHSGAGSQTDFLVGYYGGVSVDYALANNVAVFVGAQFQGAGRPVNHEKGKEAILNLDQSVIVSVGASYSF